MVDCWPMHNWAEDVVTIDQHLVMKALNDAYLANHLISLIVSVYTTEMQQMRTFVVTVNILAGRFVLKPLRF